MTAKIVSDDGFLTLNQSNLRWLAVDRDAAVKERRRKLRKLCFDAEEMPSLIQQGDRRMIRIEKPRELGGDLLQHLAEWPPGCWTRENRRDLVQLRQNCGDVVHTGSLSAARLMGDWTESNAIRCAGSVMRGSAPTNPPWANACAPRRPSASMHCTHQRRVCGLASQQARPAR